MNEELRKIQNSEFGIQGRRGELRIKNYELRMKGNSEVGSRNSGEEGERNYEL